MTNTCVWRLICCKHCSLLHPARETEVRILQLSKYQYNLGGKDERVGWAYGYRQEDRDGRLALKARFNDVSPSAFWRFTSGS